MTSQLKGKRIQDQWLVVIGIVLIAGTLRAPLTAVGPILNQIKEDLHINNGIAGLITTIPLIIFGIVSPIVSKVLTRFSMSHVLFYAILLLIVGLVVRVSGGILSFFIGTVIIGIAIAFSNVTLPAYGKWRFPLQIGLITGIYSVTINFSAGLGGGLSYPFSTMTPLSYRFSLVFWGLIAICAILVWLPQLRKTNDSIDDVDMDTKGDQKALKIYRSKLAWAVALLMAFQSMMFFSMVTWYPSILVSKGIAPESAGYFLMLNQFAQLPMTFTFPIIAAKMQSQRNLVFIIVGLMGAGFSLLFTESYWLLILAMILTGMGIGACFSLCMTLFSIRAKTTRVSMALSGFGQSVGYWVAAIGPFLIGVVYDMMHTWSIVIVLLLMMNAMVLIVGSYATKNEYIG
ncbi:MULTISPECIES: MFS transporter [unclassified Staphylococcus]|uniref:CynX/NimT family MFS transporter n=1 Tax=unclassified Staphylococcus TaxID=91994 RepID=UPI0021CFEC0D|nr:MULTISPECIES: MFS transporter [unclassified Staphylococcus]UXR76034.1 MFS transporter [Staphylococcus sp. IVB6233]UXR80232.1 MFS transporter [Staphylococcus sp. IVB6218]